MLEELVVTDLGVIDHVDVAFAEGCNALTGETGAGKTLLVAALSLLLGSRADRGLVRAGAARATVQARFRVRADHPATTALAEAGVPTEIEGSQAVIVVSRTLDAAGGSKTRVNGVLTTAGTLSSVGPLLVEIAGQHEHHHLGGNHLARSVLDSFAGPEARALADRVAGAVRAAAAAQREAQQLSADARARAREIDTLEHEVSEIDAAELRAGELAELDAAVARLSNAQELTRGLDRAAEGLTGERGVASGLDEALRTLGGLTAIDPELAPLRDRVGAALYEIDDIASELRARVAAPDPAALEQASERLDVVRRLLRKYGNDEEAVLSYAAEARDRLTLLTTTDRTVEDLRSRAIELRAEADALAERLGRVRRQAAPEFSRRITELLHELALPSARFEARIDACDLTEGGGETVTLMVSANQGEAMQPVSRVASGGELSRIALALRLVSRTGPAPTVVFDEVDAGVGGKAAVAVGRRLAEVAAGGTQVLLVTHLPQVAAFADTHLVVAKESSAGRTSSFVGPAKEGERVVELSRMLAGLPESMRAREHAKELLELAGRTG